MARIQLLVDRRRVGYPLAAVKSPVYNAGYWIPYWAQSTPDSEAVIDGATRLCWRELEARTQRLAGALQQAGVGPGDRVGLLLANRSAYLEALFATCRLGAICMPINTRLSPREIAFLLDDATPTALILERELSEQVARACKASHHRPSFQLAVGKDTDEYERALANARPLSPVAAVSPDDPMILMYTSGTTGEPKGALLPHRKALFNSLNAQVIFSIRREDRVLIASPLFHSLALQIISIPVLHSGGCIVLQRDFSPDALLGTVARERISYLGTVPTVYQGVAELLEASGSDGVAHFDLRSLRFCFSAGSALDVELVTIFQRHGLVLKQGYGQTETSLLCCLEERDAVRKAGTVGRPVFHVELRVVALPELADHPNTWRDVVGDETGEIVVRGPITMLGYWQRPDATAETLREEGWLRTNDLATVDSEGFIRLCGRTRDMYISGGENVYPAEVEAVYSEHPAIREIAVVGVEHPRWGETGRAHVVPMPQHPVNAEELLRWGRERLARFKLPDSFVVEQALPRTPTGKVQKHRLLEDPRRKS